MDFGIQIFGRWQITEGFAIYLTETLLVTWIIIGILGAFAILVKIKSKKWEAIAKPTGLQNVVELAVDTFDNFFRNSAGTKTAYLAPWFFTLFVFLLIANSIGLFGLRPPTADWAMTFPLAISSLILFQYAGLRHRPKNYILGFFQPIFIFFPINLIGELAKPVALSFRLFGNVIGGVILISLLYGLPPFLASIGVSMFGLPAVLHAYFDVAAGLLQAFIFVVLSITFTSLAAED